MRTVSPGEVLGVYAGSGKIIFSSEGDSGIKRNSIARSGVFEKRPMLFEALHFDGLLASIDLHLP